MERLHKFMARAGVASRRRCEELIARGRVTVNGVQVPPGGMMINPNSDVVAVDGDVIQLPASHVYIALNKPMGVVTTASDTHGRRTVMNLVPSGSRRVFPVGRLDMDSEGLLLLTDDGELAFALTHPSRGVQKTYSVRLAKPVSPADLRALEAGIQLDDGITGPASARIADKAGYIVEITISEGRKRQVRRMFAALGNEVQALTRIAFGCVELGKLAEGAYRELTGDEVLKLRRMAGEGRSDRGSREGANKVRLSRGGPTRTAADSRAKRGTGGRGSKGAGDGKPKVSRGSGVARRRG